MEVFEITGGEKLSGTIRVGGSKNATTPILAATLLSREPSVIRNIPRIEDVFRMLEILESLGAEVTWLDDHAVKIEPKTLSGEALDLKAVKRIRSSILLLGPLSARLDHFALPEPGGCVIGARPVNTHLDALEKLGVKVTETEAGYDLDTRGKKAGKVVLKEFSVTATENALMLAAALPGKTTIKIAAAEPHVEDLCHFLLKMGVEITGIGTHTLEVTGKTELHGAEYSVMPDHNEAATFLILGVVTGSSFTVDNAIEDHLDLVLEKLREFGAEFEVQEKSIKVIPAKELRAVKKLDTRTYPGLPTDVQAPFGVLATQATGETFIFDTLFEGRFSYVSELEKMGARATVLNPHQVVFHGKTPLKGTVIKSYDLRAGVALIIAALCARGTTVIQDIYQVDRGYERIEERLLGIGAKIERKEQS